MVSRKRGSQGRGEILGMPKSVVTGDPRMQLRHLVERATNQMRGCQMVLRDFFKKKLT